MLKHRNKAEQRTRVRIQRGPWMRFWGVVAAFVVFVTTYALILPALTLDTVCDYEEHTHDESCYSQALTCGLDEDESHTHSEDCYSEVLTCGLTEHVHTDACYDDSEEEEDVISEETSEDTTAAVSDDAEDEATVTETAAEEEQEETESAEEASEDMSADVSEDLSDDIDQDGYACSLTGETADGAYQVTVSYNDDAALPEGTVVFAEMSATETSEEEVEAIAATCLSADTDGDDEDVTAASVVRLSITLVQDGAELEPAEGSLVQVSIRIVGGVTLEEDESLIVVHYADEETTEVIDELDVVETEDGDTTITFETESFSDYEIMTVAGPGDTDGPGTGGPGEGGDEDDDDSASSVSYYHIDVRIDGSISITSSYTAGETDITVTKEWSDGDSEHESITVYLVDSDGNRILASNVSGYEGEQDSDGYIYVTLSESNNWTYTWTDIGLSAGTYMVEEVDVDGYTTSYSDNSIVVTESEEDSEATYTGTLTVTALTSVTIVDADTKTQTTVTMRDGTTKDENNQTTYEYQSLYGHEGYTDEDAFDLVEGDTIVLVISFTYQLYDSEGNAVGDLVTVTDFTYSVVVDEDDNECDGVSGKNTYGFDIVISAEDLLESYGATTKGEITIINTKLPDIQIKKVDSTDGETVLGGAVFTLSRVEDEETYYYTERGTWSETSDNAEEFATDDSTGLTDVISGLEYDTYYLTEVTAPNGYVALTSPITISVSSTGVTAYYGETALGVAQDEDGIYVITVTNSAGYELPSTGGWGDWWLRILGFLVLALAICGATYGEDKYRDCDRRL